MLSAKHKGKKKENAFILIKKTTKLTAISREKYLDRKLSGARFSKRRTFWRKLVRLTKIRQQVSRA